MKVRCKVGEINKALCISYFNVLNVSFILKEIIKKKIANKKKYL